MEFSEAKQKAMERWIMEWNMEWSAALKIGEVEDETMRHLVGGDHLRCVST